MLRKVTLLVGVGLLVGAAGTQAFAQDNRTRTLRQDRLKTQDRWTNTRAGHLELFEKDPTTWEVVEDGAWGRMQYSSSGRSFQFAFNGHGLVPDSAYTLIYYPDPWPAYGLICLGEGLADEFGHVRILNSLTTGDLPADYDDNFEEGAKIWLVLSSDVNCDLQQMELWNPTEYLFESELIFYAATTTRRGGHHHGPPDRTRIAMGLYERLEGDPEDARGTGELYGCAKAEPGDEGFLIVDARLRYAMPETVFNVFVKVGEDLLAAQSNPILVGEVLTDVDGHAWAEFEVDVSTFTGPKLYVQVVVEPRDVSDTLGYASDTRPMMLWIDGDE